jgi:hypothetical protein
VTATALASFETAAEQSMRRVMQTLEQHTARFDAHPLFDFLRDASIPAQDRLAFVPALAHFVMTFADLYRFVLRDEPAQDEYQKLVNAHTYEDGGHWKWFLADLENLGRNQELPFNSALKVLWGDDTIRLRMLSYHMCRLGIGASSLHKLVLVECIEATGSVMLRNIAPVGAAVAREIGKNLVYFGAHHFDTESDHTLEQEDAQNLVDDIQLTPEQYRELSSLVQQAFQHFTATATEVLAFAHSARAGQRAV